ncbi:acetyltransferase [Selenomonas bovis]|uniref:acetyltransferase n=1 Tax=Selenomonas bovis TaxID=416586 RepID=UPI00037BEA76|nr:acetyltransferase [Selenomonas bovis]
MEKPLIIAGAGRHALALVDMLQEMGKTILGFSDPDETKWGTDILNVPVLGSDEDIIHRFPPSEIDIVNGVGSIRSLSLRKKIYCMYKQYGYSFVSVIHPSAIISSHAHLGEGVQIFAGAIVYAMVSIGDDSIINTKANVSCESVIGNHVHVAPGVVISGGVTVDDEAHVGTGSVIIQGAHIGRSALIGAGAVVLHEVKSGKIYVGVPAREIDYHDAD